MNLEVLYTAAHAEFPDTEPLGGAKAVADYLIHEWRERQPFPLTVFSPKSLGFLAEDGGLRSVEAAASRGQQSAPLHNSLTQLSELEYARFCRRFEAASTAEILKRDPQGCVVLSNDISEGPNFAALGGRGYRIVTIFHVDVLEFFTAFYLHNLVRPETLAKFRYFSLLPDVLRLVFQKQCECVQNSARIVVPSAPMRETILRCYPECPSQKIAVVPWGDVSPAPVAPGMPLHRLPEIADDEFVILTLSRLSPEKGIERLLHALRHLDNSQYRLHVVICGAPAYMKGQRYARWLRKLAAQLNHIPVEFPGHVTGAQKAALLQRADLFVSPSRHESYGLTIAEALSGGCRVISHPHYGAGGMIVDCSKPMVLAHAIADMMAAGWTPKTTRAETKPAASPTAAEQLVGLLIRAHDS
jgi:glycosyltransferase involved in cell wall biosynthesis